MRQKVIIDEETLAKDPFMPENEETDAQDLFELNDRDIYTEEGIMSRLEDEEIDEEEGGFMLGWISA